jgi:hypothetical protein
VFAGDAVMSTESILAALCELDEAPWADIHNKPLNARGLAQRLRQYGIRSKVVRIGETPHGYAREDFTDAWSRYLPEASQDETSRGGEEEAEEHVGPPPEESATSATSATLTLVDDLGSRPGRCPSCGWHIDTQGHAVNCEEPA